MGMDWFRNVWPKRQERERTGDTLVLPRSVMEEIISQPDHTIGVEQLRRLVRDGESRPTEFANAALYSLIKIAAEDPGLQQEIVSCAVTRLSLIKTQEEARLVLRDLVEEFLTKVPADARMAAGKLKRLNLAGVRYWDDWYATHAERLARDKRAVFIVGNSMFIGLSSFVRAFRDANKPLYVLEPAFIENAQETADSSRISNYQTGYVIQPDGQVRGLSHGFRRPPDAVVIDDIRDTGSTERKILTYWGKDGSPVPAFEPLEVINGK